MTKIFSLQLSDEDYDILDEMAKEKDRSKGYIARIAILNLIQDYKDSIKAEKISKEIKSGKRKVSNFEDVLKKL